jgi:hypothetical protein
MLRIARLPTPRMLLAASAALGLLTMAAQPAAAAPVPGDTPGSKTDLVGAASTFGEQTTTMFLTNTGPSALRAIVTVRDSDDALVGCGVRMLRKGESDFLYFRSWQSGQDGALVVTVYGVQATGSLLDPLTAQHGLRGVITQVREATGETIAELEMLPVSSSALERQAQIDECFTTGFAGSGTAGSTNALTATEPGRWNTKSQAPLTPSSSPVTVTSSSKKPKR